MNILIVTSHAKNLLQTSKVQIEWMEFNWPMAGLFLSFLSPLPISQFCLLYTHYNYKYENEGRNIYSIPIP
jgi:hypothetical protein